MPRRTTQQLADSPDRCVDLLEGREVSVWSMGLTVGSRYISIRCMALPAASMHLLLALLDGEQHGYALMRRVEELSDGSVKMGPGTLYGTINRLLKDGLIVETDGPAVPEDDRRRRYYRLTADGDRVAHGELARLRALVARFRNVRVRLT
jgi:DNA-binding PadR family transcriptional regulator